MSTQEFYNQDNNEENSQLVPADKIHFLPKVTFLKQISRLYYTLKPLRWEQYWYRVWHPVKKIFYCSPEVPAKALLAAKSLPKQALFALPVFDFFDPGSNSFLIHSINQSYTDEIDWNEQRHGMLWAYHLNYFGWLRDERVADSEQLKLLQNYATDGSIKIGLDSYPISLRSVAWIRFFIQNGIHDDVLNQSLYRHCHRLAHFPEYQIQGNHLWENGCALMIAGCYFDDDEFYKTGKKILEKALWEQVLSDGGHLEGSPMYHSLLLSSLLQCVEFLELSKPDKEGVFFALLRKNAALMLGWLEQVTFSNGNWPSVNDSTGGVAPSLAILKDFAQKLNIDVIKKPLKESGYRMFREGDWELFVDVANIQPAWQPGHAHADLLSFCLHYKGVPIIVDPGVSTYAINNTRYWERSTNAHNTITLDGQNSSDTWKSFRIGQRARVTNLEEKQNYIAASYTGFANPKKKINRKFEIIKNNIIICDSVGAINYDNVELHLHFHPDIIINKIDDFDFLAGNLHIKILGAKCTFIEPYNFAETFNRTIAAKRIRIVAFMPINITIENITC